MSDPKPLAKVLEEIYDAVLFGIVVDCEGTIEEAKPYASSSVLRTIAREIRRRIDSDDEWERFDFPGEVAEWLEAEAKKAEGSQ